MGRLLALLPQTRMVCLDPFLYEFDERYRVEQQFLSFSAGQSRHLCSRFHCACGGRHRNNL